MNDDQDPIDLEMDRLSIPEQLSSAEQITEDMAAAMAVIGAMMCRLFAAAQAEVFSNDEAERFLVLLERINFLIATAQKNLVVET